MISFVTFQHALLALVVFILEMSFKMKKGIPIRPTSNVVQAPCCAMIFYSCTEVSRHLKWISILNRAAIMERQTYLASVRKHGFGTTLKQTSCYGRAKSCWWSMFYFEKQYFFSLPILSLHSLSSGTLSKLTRRASVVPEKFGHGAGTTFEVRLSFKGTFC